MNVPEWETPRLLLRGHTLDDFKDCAALWSDADVMRYIGPPLSPEQSWSRLLRHIGHWTAMGFGYWAVREKSTGKLVGEVGFANYKRDLNPPLDEVPEMGWLFVTEVRGRGYATEAVQALLHWAEVHFSTQHIVCIIKPENAASLRVAEKCGFAVSHLADYNASPTLVCVRKFLGQEA